MTLFLVRHSPVWLGTRAMEGSRRSDPSLSSIGVHAQVSLRVLVILVALSTAVACATTPPPSPFDAESSIIGIRVKVRAFKLFSTAAERVYFVRLDERAEEVVPSNYAGGGYIYLVNAAPGRYAAVAAANSRQTNRSSGPVALGPVTLSTSSTTISQDTTYLPTELIEKTAVTVGPGIAAFMGDLVVDRSGLQGADESQLHYLRLVTPDDEGRDSLMATFVGMDRSYKGTGHKLDQSAEARQKFLKRSRKLMADTGWASVLQNPVGAAPPE